MNQLVTLTFCTSLIAVGFCIAIAGIVLEMRRCLIAKSVGAGGHWSSVVLWFGLFLSQIGEIALQVSRQPISGTMTLSLAAGAAVTFVFGASFGQVLLRAQQRRQAKVAT